MEQTYKIILKLPVENYGLHTQEIAKKVGERAMPYG